ncbi:MULTISPECIES: YphA family membrane protein [Bacillus]|uniref:YphA family membrane protein n=1 Tax=Bacillus TaxID=1386 RepID=UPI000BB8BC76|nr:MULTISPECIES: hypothetical protein [Bacillus]
MEGHLFYYLAWVGWIIVFFFFSDKKLRFLLSSVILLLIICSHFYINVLEFRWNLAYFVLLVATFFFLSKVTRKNSVYMYFASTSISLVYVTFIIFEIFDPVFIFLGREWMLTFIILYMCFMLFKEKEQRYIGVLTGLLQGELLAAFIIYSVFGYNMVAELPFWEIVTLSIAGLSIWVLFEKTTAYLNSLIQKHIKQNRVSKTINTK